MNPAHFRPTWADWLIHWRWALVLLWIALQLAMFNGQWRIGLDSAIYRQVARSLAAGEGYVLFGEPQQHIYPGLPYMLAGLQMIFGEVAWPGVLVMVLMSAATVVLTYLLARRMLPAWGATLVAAGVGFSYEFVQHSHELMTDMPFLLGLVMAWYGAERVTDAGWRARLAGALLLAAGLGLAASMRPTFWVAVAGWLGAGLLLAGRWTWRRWGGWGDRIWGEGVGVVRSHPRTGLAVGAGIAAVLVVAVAFFALDPRTSGIDPVAGQYEAEVLASVAEAGSWLRQEGPGRAWMILTNSMVKCFYGVQLWGLNVIWSALLLGGTGWMILRRPAMGLTVLALIAAAFLTATAPRYFIMVLPVLWIGFIAVLVGLARACFRSHRAQSAFVAVAAFLVIGSNFGHTMKLVIEQRRTPFEMHYRKGSYYPSMQMAQVIREHTEPGDVIVGPWARILSYESDRRVLGRRDLYGHLGNNNSIAAQAAALERSGADWMVFPAEAYRTRDPITARLIRAEVAIADNPRERETYFAGEFNGVEWYLTRWAIDHEMLGKRQRAQDRERARQAGQDSGEVRP